jgi:formiminoglutamase
MDWQARYHPPKDSSWQGLANVPSRSFFFQHIKLLDLLSQSPKKTSEITFALLGFRCDEGILRDKGREGAKEGPHAVRMRLSRLPVQKPEIHCYDAGDILCTDHDLEKSQKALAEVVAILLKAGIRPIVIGGGHEVAWGHYQGIAKVYPEEERLGIINFDSHFDLQKINDNRGSATTSFYQIAEAHQKSHRHFDYNCIGIQHASNIRLSFDMAKHKHTKTILADDLYQGLQEKSFDFIDRVIDENDIIYVSLSLDVFSPAFAPGVSTIQPLGLMPWHIIPLLRQAAASTKVISYDIAELMPNYDIGERTAKLAATLIYEIIHHHNEPGHPKKIK